MSRAANEGPWWLAPGPERCPACGRPYHEEAGYWCCICDRPVCPLCVILVLEPAAAYCPECHERESD